MIPKKLYHATYLPFLNSIKASGLGNTKNKMWTDSKTGVVYLAKDPWIAESYAEESEWLDYKEDVYEYLDNIVILEIDTDKLDVNNLYRDENILPGDDEVIGFEYHGIIPWEACRVFESTISEEFHEYENIESQSINEKLVCACDNKQEVKTELAELDESIETDFATAFKQYANLWD